MTEVTSDLYRTVKPTQVQTTFRFNLSKTNITLEELFQNFPPNLLGSFRVDSNPNKREIALLKEDGNVMVKISSSFRPPYCPAKRFIDAGISCFNWETHTQNGNISQLPPVSDSTLEADVWYFLEAVEIPNNATINDFLQNNPNDVDFHYNDTKCATFLSYKLPMGCQIPVNFECYFDNNPAGHWTIRRAQDDSFTAEVCQIDGFKYALVRELVIMGWLFEGIHIKGCAEPTEFRDPHDKELWSIAMVIYEHFCQLSSKELVNEASACLLLLSGNNYARESCNDRDVVLMLMIVLDDLCMYCDRQELDLVFKFKSGLNVDKT